MTGIQVERGTNFTTFSGVSSMLLFSKVPATMPNLMAVARVVPADKPMVDKPLHIKLSATVDGEEAFKTEHMQEHVTIEKEGGYVAIIPIDGAPFPNFGTYTVSLYANDRLLIKRPIYVKNLKNYQPEP